MITSKSMPLLALLCGLCAAPGLSAATFDSGSDGSFGHINVAVNQTLVLNMPPDGVFKCGNITIGCNGVLAFNRNALNTPVFLLATGAVSISGAVVVSGGAASGSLGGASGNGGFLGGMGGIAGGRTVAGDGSGPGGGRNGTSRRGGVFAYPAGTNTNTYGNALLYPIIGGSGGAGYDAGSGGYGGGGGGGAIVIASNSKIELFYALCCCNDNGFVIARGGAGADGAYGGGGSGGAIRLVAPYVGGNGRLDTAGGLGGRVCCTTYPESGSAGRIRIDCLDDYAYRSLAFVGSFTRGSQMWVFQPNTPRLDILEAAGQSIALGISNAVTVALPFGAPTNHTVSLRAENFTNNVPIRIAVTPDTGPSLTFDGTIASATSPATNSFNVIIPAGTISRIDAWTR